MKLDHQVYVGFSVLFLFFVILFFKTNGLGNRISEINKKIDEGDYDIRNHLEKILIGSFNVNYHHEHHIFPNIPWYNLKKLSKLISKNVQKNNTSS